MQNYVIDKRGSQFTVRAFASGALSVFGHDPVIAIRDISGEAGFGPAPAESFLHMRIKANSFEVTGNISSKDRREIVRTMNEEVLEVAKYPEIVYEGKASSVTQVGEGRQKVELAGKLTLHGVTQSQGLTTQVVITGDMLRANGEFSLLQSDYGIKPVSVAGGGLKLKDELKFTFDIVARKKG